MSLPDSHITPSCNINNSKNKMKYAPLAWPPANMANPWFGSDVAARYHLATLRAAVVQSPLVALKMSTALLLTRLLAPAHAQRISVHLQRNKASLFSRNTSPPTPTSHHLAISTTQK
jgi:hypothetical protein